MNPPDRVMSSDYMDWAKTCSRARFNLATSGVANLPLAELQVRLEDLELSGPSWYGYEPLQQALAAKCGVPVDCVVAATGTSMANHLALAALIEPGDEVLIELPTYELLLATARYLRADVKRFIRRHEHGFTIEPQEIERAMTGRTKLIVITNLHNPSSAFTEEATLEEVGRMAARVGARVLVDEVYLDAAFELSPRSAFHLGDQFITTNSLTKVYGLSGVRCGWVLAQPDLARRLWRLNDLFGVIPAHPAERLSVVALREIDRIRLRAKSLLDSNRQALAGMLDSCTGISSTKPEYGTVVFPRLSGDVDALCKLLRNKYETTVVPGRFFGMPEHFRIGIGGDTRVVAEGLKRLSEAIAEVSGK